MVRKRSAVQIRSLALLIISELHHKLLTHLITCSEKLVKFRCFFIPSILPRGTPIFSLFWKSKQQKLTPRNPDITQKKGSLFQLMLFVNKMSEFLDPINFLKSYSIYNEFVKSRYFSFTEHRVGLIKRKYLKNSFLVIWRPIANNAIYLSNKTSK